MTIYTFEGANADDTYSTADLDEAREYARRYSLAIVANEYEWMDDEVIEDHRSHDDPTWIADHE